VNSSVLECTGVDHRLEWTVDESASSTKIARALRYTGVDHELQWTCNFFIVDCEVEHDCHHPTCLARGSQAVKNHPRRRYIRLVC